MKQGTDIYQIIGKLMFSIAQPEKMQSVKFEEMLRTEKNKAVLKLWKRRNIFFGDKQMITLVELEKILNVLSQQKNISFETQSCTEISGIVYKADHFKYGSTTIKYRHIDIEFEFGVL